MNKPWENEPDEMRFTTAEGLPAILLRHPSLKHWCGYVGIPADHPLFGAENPDVEVHGGITYSGRAAPREQPDGRWWLGFDCAHWGDFSPGIGEALTRRPERGEVYRDLAYAVREARALSRRLAGRGEAHV